MLLLPTGDSYLLLHFRRLADSGVFIAADGRDRRERAHGGW